MTSLPDTAFILQLEGAFSVPVYALLGVHVKMSTYKYFRPKTGNNQPNFLS